MATPIVSANPWRPERHHLTMDGTLDAKRLTMASTGAITPIRGVKVSHEICDRLWLPSRRTASLVVVHTSGTQIFVYRGANKTNTSPRAELALIGESVSTGRRGSAFPRCGTLPYMNAECSAVTNAQSLKEIGLFRSRIEEGYGACSRPNYGSGARPTHPNLRGGACFRSP